MAISFAHDWREFHVSRAARDKYHFPDALFASSGRALLSDFGAAQRFAAHINAQRDAQNSIRASEIVALGLIDEILHGILAQFQQQKSAQLFPRALQVIADELGNDSLDQTLQQFVNDFPPTAVYKGEIAPDKYLQMSSSGTSHREIALEELLVLHLSNQNSAAHDLRELFDDTQLTSQTSYTQIIDGLREFFDGEPTFGPNEQSLFALLRAPLELPTLQEQLRWIVAHWSDFVPPKYLQEALRGLDMAREEEKPQFFGPGPAQIPDYQRARLRSEVEAEEPENFSDDRDWMPRAVVLAKNAYVWLEQLCRKYSQPIYSLDAIPDAELKELQSQGFTGLWLIGLWERSVASKTIKQKCGNAEAEASAYSLKRYEIADDLGGWPALENLRERALKCGIRMASDMVPNHMGIDADWVVTHPDWFVQTREIPFPTYRFHGPNLSPVEHIGLFLEDGYYDQSEAAVVFQRVDYTTNDVRYIYHGNDGTLMPWNDTAQLNYLLPQVREALIQTILHVARNFPIIRFDAAMTLAKRHFQRLWFPEPGTGGDIASRAWFGLTMDEFDAQMPEEFWREVVDRVAVETPDTLLLAEAFWMMEGYFVRSLGMHRVYNSAFMNMLRDEENANYRLVLKNTLEFDPEILKRFVNFVNNPDEKTAREQFGDGDKYFGVCTLMATLPGLPMFGHGQIEGFNEKYGMEYRQAKWHEMPDEWLVERHQREIFPLLHRRALFAEVEHFQLFDWYHESGGVDENVFAFSNSRGDERALVIVNNAFNDTRGTLHRSSARFDKDARELKQSTLQDALQLTDSESHFVLMRDIVSGLEHLQSSRELCQSGWKLELKAYGRHVFCDIREIEDIDGKYAALHHELRGAGVPNVQAALREGELFAMHTAFNELLGADLLKRLVPTPHFAVAPAQIGESPSESGAKEAATIEIDFATWEQFEARMTKWLRELDEHQQLQIPVAKLVANARERITTLHRWLASAGETGAWLRAHLNDCASWTTLLAFVFVADLPQALNETLPDAKEDTDSDVLEKWLLRSRVESALERMNVESGAANYAADTLQTLLRFAAGDLSEESFLNEIFADEIAARVLSVNEHQEVLWFNREAWASWSAQLLIAHALMAPAATSASTSIVLNAEISQWTRWIERADAVSYRVREFVRPLNLQVEKTIE